MKKNTNDKHVQRFKVSAFQIWAERCISSCSCSLPNRQKEGRKHEPNPILISKLKLIRNGPTKVHMKSSPNSKTEMKRWLNRYWGLISQNYNPNPVFGLDFQLLEYWIVYFSQVPFNHHFMKKRQTDWWFFWTHVLAKWHYSLLKNENGKGKMANTSVDALRHSHPPFLSSYHLS